MNDRRATIIAPRAAREIDEAAAWWRRNRPSAKRAFDEELQRALDLVSTYPSVGFKAVNLKLPRVRRIHLSRIQYHLYYRLSSDNKTVEILALWHARRGSGPPL